MVRWRGARVGTAAAEAISAKGCTDVKGLSGENSCATGTPSRHAFRQRQATHTTGRNNAPNSDWMEAMVRLRLLLLAVVSPLLLLATLGAAVRCVHPPSAKTSVPIAKAASNPSATRRVVRALTSFSHMGPPTIVATVTMNASVTPVSNTTRPNTPATGCAPSVAWKLITNTTTTGSNVMAKLATSHTKAAPGTGILEGQEIWKVAGRCCGCGCATT